MVALIPARAGSKRVPGKNTRLLAGHPLIAYTIHAAQQSGVFSRIYVVTSDVATIEIADEYGAVVCPRVDSTTTCDAADISWVRERVERNTCDEAFAILRPTSPFRTAATIRRAYQQFRSSEVHSLRAVEPVKQHPGKMWWCNEPGYPLTPVCDAKRSDGTPWHSSPTQTLPPCYVQNSSLEMAWTYVVTSYGTISGTKIAPFFTEGYEGLAIDTEDDWREAERLVREGLVTLPTVRTRRTESPASA